MISTLLHSVTARALMAMSLISAPLASRAGALEDYVTRADDAFAFTVGEHVKRNGAELIELQLTSQKWREHVWTHPMLVIRPATVRNPDIAFLFITGDSRPTRYLELLQTLADRAGAIAAVVTRVPNQPLYDGRKEDALIAYTFVQFLETGDKTWPLLFPMVKSAVSAMDAIEQLAAREFNQQIKRFTVAGASKRGWTTWLTAAADPRVAAIAPMVIDMLNMKEQLKWAEKMYGRQSEQISDYTDLNLHLTLDDPGNVELRDMVDPYAYRARYTMPKLILLGTNDPYWVVDSIRHYWNDLPGPKLIFQTPNAGHDLNGGREATATLAAWFQMIADRQPLPEFEWDFNGAPDGIHLTYEASQQPKSVRLWTAESKDRDFRDDQWSSTVLDIDAPKGSAEIGKPAQGYRAGLLELTLVAPTGHEYRLSSEARVTPEKK